MPIKTIHGDGEAPNILTDLRDIGRFVAHIIRDDRTLNKYVYTSGDVLSENDIFRIAKELSGEELEPIIVSHIPLTSMNFNTYSDALSRNQTKKSKQASSKPKPLLLRILTTL